MEDTRKAVMEARAKVFDKLYQSLDTKDGEEVFTRLLKVGKERQKTWTK